MRTVMQKSGRTMWARGCLGTAVVLGICAAQAEADFLLWDQSDVAPNGGGSGISTTVSADDFVLSRTFTLTRLRVWIVDFVDNDNGMLDNFSGTLSFAIYADVGGAPAPAAIGPLFFQNSNPTVTDAGFQGGGNFDVAFVDITITGGPTLAAGTYWLALHEGDWLSQDDRSNLEWYGTTTPMGTGAFSDPNETNPGSDWQRQAPNIGFAFQVFGVPEPATTAVLLLGLGAMRRRRRRG